MCIGVPLQVLHGDGHCAWCADGEESMHLDMMLVGEQPAGTWVLAFQGAARQVLSETEAGHARAARLALASALQGRGDLDEFFDGLAGHEPQLPAHLRKAAS